MPPDDLATIKATYPLPVYNYRVTIDHEGGPQSVGFAEVSGLSVEHDAVTYKHGLSFVMGTKIIPGMRQPIRITLQRGIVKAGSFLADWFQSAYNDPYSTNNKRDIVIDLCDETGSVVIRWTVKQALPVKLDAPTFAANSNDIAIETLEVVAHGLEVNFNP